MIDNNIIQADWYKNLINDLRKLEYTGIVLTKWNIGKRIVQDELKFGKPEYGSKRIENLAKDLKTTASDIWACIRFYKKYLDGVQQLQGKSWREIWHKYLPSNVKEVTEEDKQAEREVIKKLREAGKYQIIYADPPWQYYEGGYKNQSQHYPTKSLEYICTLPITDLAADDCLLFMWVTFPMLDQFIDVMRCWGFEYSTVAFTWIKSKQDGTGFFYGLGNWTRSNAEICVLGRRGSIERKDASISQIIYTPLEEHSKKPAIVRDKIVQLVGDLPRIELFARQRTEGWDVWGNEV